MNQTQLKKAKADEPDVTEAEKILLTAIERAVETNADFAISILVSRDGGAEILASTDLTHVHLAAILGALAQQHYAAAQEEIKAHKDRQGSSSGIVGPNGEAMH